MISSKNVPQGVLVPFGVLVGDYLIPDRVGSISLVNFICMCPSLVPDLPTLLWEKVVGEYCVNVIEGEVVRLGDIL